MSGRAKLVGSCMGAAWLTVALPLAVPAAAAVSCPAFAPERTWLAVLAQEGQPLTPAQTRALAQSGAIFGYPVGVLPPRGPVPLTVGLVWIARPPDPQAIEFDADGDGVAEVVDTREEAFGHTYRTPGQYPATVRVRDRQGQVTTYRSPVTVLTPEAFDAELRERWAALKAALGRGQLEAAVECVAALARPRTERALRRVLGGDVEQALPPIRFVELRVIEAVYESVRPAAGDTVPFEVRFQVDLDGVWRVAGFKRKEGSP